MNRTGKNVAFVGILFCCAGILASQAYGWPAQFKKWHVDASVGNDGNGSSSNPFKNLEKAVSEVMAPGDTIYVKNGLYTLSETLELAEGVSLVGENRDATIIQTSADLGLYLKTNGDSNAGQLLKSFTLKTENMQSKGGIRIQSRNYVTIDGLHLEGFRDFGITAWAKYTQEDPGVENYLLGLQIKNNILKDCSHSGGSSYSGAIQLGQSYGALVYNNQIDGWRDDHGYGIKFAGGGWVANCKIFNNVVSLTPYTITGGWGAPFSIEFFNAHSNTEIFDNEINGAISLVKETGYPGTQVKVHGNKVIMPDVKAKEGIEGNAPRLEIYGNYFENVLNRGAIRTDWGAQDHDIHHNIIRNSGIGYGLNPRGSESKNIKFHNNIIDNCDEGIKISNTNFPNGKIENLIFQNNILINNEVAMNVQAKSSDIEISNFTISHNLLLNNQKEIEIDNNGYPLAWGEGNFSFEPEIKKSGNFPFPYYENTSGTGNLIDKGTATQLNMGNGDYTGEAPELGAHEWGLPPQSRVMVKAGQKAIREGEENKTAFIVYRNTTKGKVEVSYSLSGQVEESDYIIGPSSELVFEDGQDSIKVLVSALDDKVYDGHRQLVFEIKENEAYHLMPQYKKAWVYILDQQKLDVDVDFESGYAGKVVQHPDWTATNEPDDFFEVVANPKGDGKVLKVGLDGNAVWNVTNQNLSGEFNVDQSLVGFSFEILGNEGLWGYRTMQIKIGKRDVVEIDLRDGKVNTLKFNNGENKLEGRISRGIEPDFAKDWAKVSGLIDYETKKFLLYIDDQIQITNDGKAWMDFKDPATDSENQFPSFSVSVSSIEAPLYLDKLAMELVEKPQPVSVSDTKRKSFSSEMNWVRFGSEIQFHIKGLTEDARLMLIDIHGNEIASLSPEDNNASLFRWNHSRDANHARNPELLLAVIRMKDRVISEKIMLW